MKPLSEYEKDLSSIRTAMERSVKFISLSGLSGVLAGVYALIGASIAYFWIHYPASPTDYRTGSLQDSVILPELLTVATIVLVASIGTGILLSHRRAKQHGMSLWNVASKNLAFAMAVPLITGGVLILILLYNGHFGIAAPACLVFYGLALINGSQYTYDEVRYLGFCEIALGLISAAFPGLGLLFWAIGFGVLHVIYGSLMYYRYEQ